MGHAATPGRSNAANATELTSANADMAQMTNDSAGRQHCDLPLQTSSASSMDDCLESHGQAERHFSRRTLMATLTGMGLGSTVFARALLAQSKDANAITAEMIKQSEWIAGIELEDKQREKLAEGLQRNLRDQAAIRAVECDADIAPAAVFRPDFFAEPVPENRLQAQRTPGQPLVPLTAKDLPNGRKNDLPSDPIEIAFASLVDQARWLDSRQISSVELTRLYLERLKRHDPTLLCVVTLLEETALDQARASDNRRASRGNSLGLLDGIPWVAKDLMAVPPFKTTWGAAPFRDQVRTHMSTVARRLQEAGGVLLAKVSLGALAWGDIWFGGKTRNPWNPEQGSSGSSAGTASAVVAGLASYGIGSETLGSIVSPCVRCSVTGLRPTYGRVSRYGCMPLAWSFDKLGPIARRVEDLAVVFSFIAGPDGFDPSVVDRAFAWPDKKPISEMVIGTTDKKLSTMEQKALDWLLAQGARQQTIKLPDRFPESAMTVMLNVEATTVFDDILRSDPGADLGLWPDSFRKGQFTSAVQYLRASRLRTMLIEETEAALRPVDVVLGADDLTLTNLSGHPSIIVAAGTDQQEERPDRPATIKLTAAMFRESTLLSVAHALQQAMPPLPAVPKGFDV